MGRRSGLRILRFRAGIRLMVVSIRDVARRAGVSVGTVSNVLNHSEKVAASSVERVHAAIAELGYVRNDAARLLRAGRSSTVGLVVLDIRNPFFSDIARGAELAAAELGLSVLLGNSNEDTTREAGYLDLFEEQRVRGVLISPYREIGPRLAQLRDRGTPAVLVDRRSSDPRFSSVSVDDEVGGHLAATHLIETGRRRIAYVGGPLDMRQISDRLHGARLAAETAGLAIEVLGAGASTVATGREAGLAIAARPASERPDAVFAANDMVALGVLQGLVADRTVRVPDDIAIVGFDDIDFAASAAVPLSSVRQPREEMGETALRILAEEADDPSLAPRQVVFAPELVVRESSARQ